MLSNVTYSSVQTYPRDVLGDRPILALTRYAFIERALRCTHGTSVGRRCRPANHGAYLAVINHLARAVQTVSGTSKLWVSMPCRDLAPRAVSPRPHETLGVGAEPFAALPVGQMGQMGPLTPLTPLTPRAAWPRIPHAPMCCGRKPQTTAWCPAAIVACCSAACSLCRTPPRSNQGASNLNIAFTLPPSAAVVLRAASSNRRPGPSMAARLQRNAPNAPSAAHVGFAE